MPTVRHPRALEAVDGTPPHRVVIERERFDIDQDDYTVDLDTERQAEVLAESWGVDREAIDPDSGRGESGGSGESDENGESGPSGGATDETGTGSDADDAADEPAETCQHELTSGDRAGEVCGRDRPCPYHD